MEEDEQEQRRRKVEAGRAKLAHFRQRKTKGDCAHSKKTPAKREGAAVHAPDQEESPVAAAEAGGLLGGRDVGKNTPCSDTPDGAGVPQLQEPGGAGMPQKLEGDGPEQPGVMTKELELEVLRLSLSDMHAARLELTQAHLQREKEAALAELRAELAGRHAQERALLQSRACRELELVREEAGTLGGRPVAELKEKLQSEMEKNAQMIETLKQDWESERDLSLENLRRELLERHRSELENLQNQFKKELAEQKAELEKVFQDKNQAEFSLQTQEAQHEAALSKLRADLQLEHCQYVEDLELKFREKEKEKQLELKSLCASYTELQAQSQDEIRRPGAQLESARSRRQEPSELPKQLLAQASHVEGLEHLTRALEQQQQERTRHEAQLEQLRISSEEKLREAERGQQEDLTLLQQQLQGGKDNSPTEAVAISARSEETPEGGGRDRLDQLDLQPEQHEVMGHRTVTLPLSTSSPTACVVCVDDRRVKRWVFTRLSVTVEAFCACSDAELRGASGSPVLLPPALAVEGTFWAVTDSHESHLHTLAVHFAVWGYPMAAARHTPASRCLGHAWLFIEPGTVMGPGQRSSGGARSPELARVPLLCAHSTALEVAAGDLGLETMHKAHLLLLLTELKEEIDLLKVENRNLHEKLQHEIRLKEDLEQVKCTLVEAHQEALRSAEEKLELTRRGLGERAAEWEVTSEDLRRGAEERPTQLLLELREQAESEKLSMMHRFELREAEMRQLQDQQAAQILDLEGSLMEQQGRLRQLELGLSGDESLQCSQCGRELGGGLAPTDRDHLKEDCALQLQLAQSRFLEERREITEKFAAEQDTFLREAREKHARELQLLQERHRQHVLSLTAELETRHQAEVDTLRASLEREWWALSEARVAELQAKHAAEISALETRHASRLDALESRYLSEMQTLRGLELLGLEEQLQKEDASHPMVLTWVLEKLKLKHDEEPQSTEDGLRTGENTEHVEGVRASRLRRARQGEFESEKKAALHEKEAIHKLEREQAQSLYQKEKESLSLQLREKNNQILQLKDQILSLSREIEERHSELERLQQRRERENQEETALISMLKSDIDLSHGERRALQDALRRLLGLFGETLKATVALKSRIGERVGLCLEDESPPAGECRQPSPALDEVWPGLDAALPELDSTSPECAETSSVAEISSRVCESFFMSPESTVEYERPVRRAYRSLGLAVDGLLEMVLDSSRQLEEARQIHSRLEKEFSCKSEETAQVVRKHQELLEHLDAESAAKARLELALHTAEGIVEGFTEERAGLQEALSRKEAIEQGLVAELEGLRQQLQCAARRQAELQEESSVLRGQKAALAVEAGEREAALQKEVESLTKEHSETKEQSEKDRSALLSQMRLLEAELEEQLSRQQACARQAEELSALRQQMGSLDQQLRRQRQFMDAQAVEREREREDFQQEIQRLEEQLRQAARPRLPGPRDSDVSQPLDGEIELLEEKLREKSDGLNELIIKKELADRQVLIQKEEIKRLQETNASTARKLMQLQGELERQRKAARDLEQDKEALQEQQMSNLLLVSTLQSKLDEGKCLGSPAGNRPDDAEVQLEAVHRTLLQHEDEVVFNRSSEIEELKSIIENLRENQERLQRDKAQEIEQLHEVIEKLQRELPLGGPAAPQAGDGRAASLQSELLGLPAEGAKACAELEGELRAALEAKEALSRLLAEQERGHGQALEALQQRLQAAEEVAVRQLAASGPGAALREAEVHALASQIREFEAALRAKEAKIAERELEIDALHQQKSAHSAELEAILAAVACFRCALEQQLLAASGEPPELQRLRAQCVRLSCQLQALNQRFLRCQKEPDEWQAHGAQVAGSSGWRASWGEDASCHEEGEQDVCGRWLAEAPHSHGGGPQVGGRAVSGELGVHVGGRAVSGELGVQSPIKEDPQLAKALPTLTRAGLSQQDSVMSVLAVCQRQLESELLLVKKEMCLPAESGVSGAAKGKEKLLEDCQLQKVDLIDQVKQLQEKLNHLVHCMSFQNGTKPLKKVLRTMDLSSWSSPEVVRKDSISECPPSLPLTPCSDALSQRSLDTSLWDGTSTQLLQADQLGLLCSPGESAAGMAPKWAGSPLAADGAPSTDHHAQRVPVEKDVEDFIITSLDSQEKSRSPPLGLEGKSDGKSDGAGFGETLSQGSGRLGAPTAGHAAPLTPQGFRRPLGARKEKEVHPKQVKALLQMVCDESHHILALSEYRGPPSILSRGEPRPPKGEKETSNVGLDWRGQFLQIVQEAFEKEREILRVEVWPRPCGSGPGGCGSLLERLEKMVQEQGDLQERSLEHLRPSDRSSLMSEIQALRAQLRMTHLQNQEKLQQLCVALTSAEARGSRQEHQLRRQVELLVYKVEQEKCMVSDLQKSLNEEQEKANNVQKLLLVEQNTVRDLKSELCECRQDKERLLKCLDEVQKEVLQLRSVLDSKEDDLQAALQQLEAERTKERVLQSRLEEERLQCLQRESQSARTLEELRASLEKQCAHSDQLRVALEHEQTARDNLRKELQIEASRCEALLAQERGRLSELERTLEAEQGRSRELSEALQHERRLTERLSRRPQDKQAQPALLQKLRGCEARVLELEVALEATRQRALEAEAHVHRQDVEREQERELELQRQRDEHKILQLQRTVRELQAREPARPREQQRGLEKVRQQLLCAAGLLTSFINQTVDRTISDWTSSNEKAVASLLHTLETLKSELGASSSCRKKTTVELQVQLVDVLLKDNESLSRALSTVTRERAELCRAMSRLERSPRAPGTPQEGCARRRCGVKGAPLLVGPNRRQTRGPVPCREGLQRREVPLALSTAACSHGGSLFRRSDRSVWKQDRMVSPGSARHPDLALPTPEAGTCNAKMEKLYLHYLRAESFRKALIYQKKYLLLLIGGFQDSEQETLSMIAHLGVFPSKADKKAVAARPFTKFRTAVRVVIAVLRLRFLVKKWQQVDGRGALAPGRAPRPGTPHPMPPVGFFSAQLEGGRKAQSNPSPNPRSERSLTASQDPEHSLTEYIHHLEMIQQRLGDVPPDSTSEKSCCQKSKQ
ncbi:PREDICTED: pericentrin [Lipotes vexillifer]|uniref:Pericentrin n=1 Tax=Lipotes vexillifer TaxID=118797 RepID=A0A340WZS2_LIPVE|nr:PREDICTED: pericentrin [Lipotes vexillifer]